MAPLLNKLLIIGILFISGFSFGQSDVSSIYAPKDFKETEQFKHFYKKRHIISAWQINQLKTGALMVRLKTNQKAIEILKKNGNIDYATSVENETFIVNKNIVRAYSSLYLFSKVYFFYSNKSDTLIKGARQGIFLDTNLNVDPKIIYDGNFYLLAEGDYAYNSSIGFIKEDTAKYIKESGNAVKEMAIIIKNKYGHQLKGPFPYMVFPKGSPTSYVKAYAIKFDGSVIKGSIIKRYSVVKYLNYVTKLNEIFFKYFESVRTQDTSDPDIKPFLY